MSTDGSTPYVQILTNIFLNNKTVYCILHSTLEKSALCLQYSDIGVCECEFQETRWGNIGG